MTGNEEKTSQTLDQIQRTILLLVNSGNYIEARRFIGIMLRHIFTGMLTALFTLNLSCILTFFEQLFDTFRVCQRFKITWITHQLARIKRTRRHFPWWKQPCHKQSVSLESTDSRHSSISVFLKNLQHFSKWVFLLTEKMKIHSHLLIEWKWLHKMGVLQCTDPR